MSNPNFFCVVLATRLEYDMTASLTGNQHIIMLTTTVRTMICRLADHSMICDSTDMSDSKHRQNYQNNETCKHHILDTSHYDKPLTDYPFLLSR